MNYADELLNKIINKEELSKNEICFIERSLKLMNEWENMLDFQLGLTTDNRLGLKYTV